MKLWDVVDVGKPLGIDKDTVGNGVAVFILSKQQFKSVQQNILLPVTPGSVLYPTTCEAVPHPNRSASLATSVP